MGPLWTHFCKQSLQHLPGNSYKCHVRTSERTLICCCLIFRTFSSACMDSIRKCFRRVLSIPFGIAFVAYKRAPWAPKGPRGPKGPLVPWALWPWAFCMGPLAHPWARPGLLGRTETALRENCAASKLRCEETAVRANGSAGARSVEEYNFIRPKGPCGTTFCYSQSEIYDIGTEILIFHCFASKMLKSFCKSMIFSGICSICCVL